MAGQRGCDGHATLTRQCQGEWSGSAGAPAQLAQGIAGFYGKRRNHIITTVTEHKCVLDSCRHLEEQRDDAGHKLFDVTYLPVQGNGLISMDALRDAITPQTALVSVMAVNNEIGVLQPLKAIGELCREKGVFFHTDAAQCAGKLPINVRDMKIDLMVSSP